MDCGVRVVVRSAWAKARLLHFRMAAEVVREDQPLHWTLGYSKGSELLTSTWGLSKAKSALM